MSKKKSKQTTKKRSIKTQLKYELIGLLFILISILGSGASLIKDGFIPKVLTNIFQFTFGIWYFIVPILLLIIGLYVVIKRKYPQFFTKRTIGFSFILVGILLITHIKTFDNLLIDPKEMSIIKATWQNFTSYTQGIGVVSQLGGGIVGGFLYVIMYFLFSTAGAKIIAVFSVLIGILFMTNFSLGKFLVKIRELALQFLTSINENRAKRQTAKKEKMTEKPAEEEDSTAKVIEVNSNPAPKEVEVAYAFEELSNGQLELPVEQEEVEELELDDELDYEITSETENDAYELPSFKLLAEPVQQIQQQGRFQVDQTINTLDETFKSFGVKARVTKAHVGPAVTKYEVTPEAGVKVSRILNLTDDLALALAAQDIRIEAPIPGKSAVGIEVPNDDVATVSLREVLDVNQNNQKKLLFALGRDISGNSIVGELNKMPHLLIAGATGSGKSVCINGIITSILMRAKPHEVKMMMIDPKKVELNVYNGIPHLLTPVVTDPKKAAMALRKVVAEMENRYELFSETGARNIEGYNNILIKQVENTDEKPALLPYIVVLVDELADLMMVASNEVEDAITRLAQMARAAGIHLIIATQRPSVDVITGVIKANIPSRIAFSVSSQVDSRTILDVGGAEKLLGRGDMLYIPVGMSKPIRVQGAFLSDEEVERIVEHCINEQSVVYQEEMIPEEVTKTPDQEEDELFQAAVDLVSEMQSASVSMLQRRFRIGYNRAARLIDMMEERNIVGPYEGNKPRIVLVEKAADEDREESVEESNL